MNRSTFGQSQQTKSTLEFWSRRRNSAFRLSRATLSSISPVRLAGLMQSDRTQRMMSAITELCVDAALVAGPQFIGRTARRQAAALHPTASFRLSLTVASIGADLPAAWLLEETADLISWMGGANDGRNRG